MKKYIGPRHSIFLYAKGWYKEEDPIKDLITLLSPYYEYTMTEEDVLQEVGSLLFDVLKENHHGKRQFVELISQININDWRWRYIEDEEMAKSFHYRFFHKALGILSVVNNDDLTKILGERLCKPDYRYLRASKGVTPEKLGRIFDK